MRPHCCKWGHMIPRRTGPIPHHPSIAIAEDGDAGELPARSKSWACLRGEAIRLIF